MGIMRRIAPIVALALASAAHLDAQYTSAIGLYVSRNDALPTEPHLGGLSFSTFSGPIGVRLNGGLHFTEREPNAFRRSSKIGVGAWTADADLVLAPFRTFASLSPYAFIGVGGQGVRFPDLPDSSLATWSLGGGLTVPLAGALSLDGDARYRRPLDDNRLFPSGYSHDWEYRLGFSIGFGSSRDRDYRRRGRTRAHPPARTHPPTREYPPAREYPPVEGRPGRSSSSHVRPSAVVATAERFLDTRYRYGGAAPSEGFDCSGFVQYVLAQQGIRLPRTAALIARYGEPVTLRERDLREGDLMFFADDRQRIDHVAIYAGNGRILHATASGGGVRYDDLDSDRGRWFMDRWVEARRLVDDQGSLVRDPGAPQRVDESELDPPDRAPMPASRP
jgi:cell wall-associated NlpC family hydrolase